MDDTGAVHDDVVVAVEHETALHLRLLKIHEERRMEGSALVQHTTADKQVGSSDVVNLHPMLRIFDVGLMI